MKTENNREWIGIIIKTFTKVWRCKLTNVIVDSFLMVFLAIESNPCRSLNSNAIHIVLTLYTPRYKIKSIHWAIFDYNWVTIWLVTIETEKCGKQANFLWFCILEGIFFFFAILLFFQNTHLSKSNIQPFTHSLNRIKIIMPQNIWNIRDLNSDFFTPKNFYETFLFCNETKKI